MRRRRKDLSCYVEPVHGQLQRAPNVKAGGACVRFRHSFGLDGCTAQREPLNFSRIYTLMRSRLKPLARLRFSQYHSERAIAATQQFTYGNIRSQQCFRIGQVVHRRDCAHVHTEVHRVRRHDKARLLEQALCT